MTRPLAITKRQAKTLLKAAKEEGGIIEVQTEIGIVRLIPGVLTTKRDKSDSEPKGHL